MKFLYDETCIICHEIIDEREEETITCHFCGNQAHSKCIHDWLLQYNMCPFCMNSFVVPSIMLG
ncbi:MAG: RING finger domain-containing protein [Promethearchaeota archaeon]